MSAMRTFSPSSQNVSLSACGAEEEGEDEIAEEGEEGEEDEEDD